MSTTSDLARQLASHPRWMWAEGMLLAEDGYDRRWRIGGRSDAHAWWLLVGGHQGRYATLRTGEWTPDLTDAATAGVLLSWLLELKPYGLRWSGPSCVGGAQHVSHFVGDHREYFDEHYLGEAAARALLTLWGPA